MEKIVELVCDYCGTEITEKNHTCPNCGADCSAKIKKYKEQKKKEEELKRAEDEKHNQELAKDVKGVVSKISIVIVAAFIMFFAIAIMGITSLSRRARNSYDDFMNNTSNDIKEEIKKIEVGFNEDAETSKYIVTLDSYELYEYKSDEFPSQYNTPAGYQKIAFHFVYTNTSNEKIYSSNISLTADDYTVDESKMETGMFEKVVKGKDKYTQVEYKYIQAGEKLQGYVGFLVPKDKKVLKFHIGNNVTITMDNPVYTE